MAKTTAFEEHTDAYDDWFDRNAAAYSAELKAIRELLPNADLHGMEIGVGSGKFAEPLGIVIGVEPCEQMAEKARALGIEVVPGVAEALPFADGVFDYALMVTTICFVDDVVRSFREALRVLRPGGFILVAYVDKESELGRQYLTNRHKSRFYQEATFYSTREVLAHLETAGFGWTEVRQTLIADASDQRVAPGYGDGGFVVVKAMKEI
ncbi:MAG: SAM-dependent methyltransferase [Desulfuromonas sp.]|nr:MAG: SAM-dependent methyltransferase [Desulfuromonas sp.]